VCVFFPNLNSPVSIVMFLSRVVVFFFFCVYDFKMFVFLTSMYAHLYIYKYAFK